ncbi:hypothetical protein DENSPDRAFT_789845, partial [Dentipellis sp. KUC8613]
KVEKRAKDWMDARPNQTNAAWQLVWVSHIVEYVSFLWKATEPDGRSKADKPALAANIPILGPRFVPPSYLHIAKRNKTPDINPKDAYLKPLTVVHPFYFPELRRCPQCGITNRKVSWHGWNATGYREVHGVRREETAIGLQLRCDACKVADDEARKVAKATKHEYEKILHCFATTSHEFWGNRHHWDIPRE